MENAIVEIPSEVSDGKNPPILSEFAFQKNLQEMLLAEASPELREKMNITAEDLKKAQSEMVEASSMILPNAIERLESMKKALEAALENGDQKLRAKNEKSLEAVINNIRNTKSTIPGKIDFSYFVEYQPASIANDLKFENTAARALNLALENEKRLKKTNYQFTHPKTALQALDIIMDGMVVDSMFKRVAKIRLAHGIRMIRPHKDGLATSCALRRLVQAARITLAIRQGAPVNEDSKVLLIAAHDSIRDLVDLNH